jgi:hypothetical protein
VSQNRRFQLQKRPQLFIRSHNETLSVAIAARAFISRFQHIVTPPAECIKADSPELWKIQLQNFILRFP